MIGMIYSRVRVEEKLLLSAFKMQRQKIMQIDPRSVILGDNTVDFDNIDIILNREISQTLSELFLEYFESIGINTINSAKSTSICNNKALCTWILQKEKTPMPKTYIACSLEQAKKAVEELTYPVVLKPLMGSWGRLLAKVENEEMLESIVEHKQALNNPYHAIFYIQEYIKKPQRDIRVFMVNKEPIAAMYRQSSHWITNTALSGLPKKCKLDKELTSLVQKVVNILDIDIAGVDIVETENGYKILEVNSTSEFHGLQTVTDINIADCIADFLIKNRKKL